MDYRGGRRSSIPAADDAVNIEPTTNRENNNTSKSGHSPCSLSTENLKAHAIAQSTLPDDIAHHPHDADPNTAYPAHQAALRRLNGTAPANKHNLTPSDSASTTSTQPVLVRSYPNPKPTTAESPKPVEMKRKQKPTTASHDLPPLESFSFQDILASIDPEIRASIDTIAEICGRSKMSLADEYDSHLPPQAQISFSNPTSLRDQSNTPSETAVLQRLEPVEESSRARHAQRHRFALASTSADHRVQHSLSSTPVAVVANVTSHHLRSSSQFSASYSEQILAWLKGSTGLQGQDGSSAADVLRGILREGKGGVASG